MIKRLSDSSSLKANILANFAGNGWAALISLIFVPLYLKYIGAEAYGLIGIFTSVQVVLSLLDSGLSTTLNKELARMSVLQGVETKMRNLVKTLGNVYWKIAIATGIIGLALSPVLANYWVKPDLLDVNTITYCFCLLSISLIFQFTGSFYSGGLLGLQRQVVLNVIRIVFATLKSVGALLILVFITKSVIVFFAWSFIVAVLQAFTLRFYVWKYLPYSPEKASYDKQALKDIWRFAAGMTGISLTAILITQMDKVILSKLLSLEQFGYYTVACTLGMFILQAVAPLTQSYFPKFSSLVSLSDITELKKKYHQASQLISTIVLPATFVLAFFSKELIFIWANDPVIVENTWLITSIYAYGTGMNSLINIPFILTLAYGWTKLSFYQNICLLILLIPLTIFFAYQYGAVGGALSWAVINTLYILITPYLIHRKILKGEIGKWYWDDIIKPLLGCLPIILLSRYLFDLSGLTIMKQLIIIGSTGLFAIAGSAVMSSHINQHIFNFLHNLKRKLQ